MASVLLIGAGGSLAQADHYRATRRGDHPPLDADFFRRVQQLSKRHPTIRTARGRLRMALRNSGKFADPWGGIGVTLEQFFADVYYEVVASRSSEALAVFVRLLDLYARTLETTTNWMASEGRSRGVIGQLLQREMERSGSTPPTVLTFNHDLVIENDVRRLPRRAGTWCLHSLYGDIGLHRVYSTGSGARFPHHEGGCAHAAPIRLLKLHGSLNWLIRTRDKDPQLGTLFPSSGNKRIYADNDVQASHAGAVINMGAGPGRTTWYGWPVIVPPIYDKQRVVGIGLLQEVWDRARAAIEEADRLVLFGYSLPDADFYARQMLRGAFSENPLADVHCINPDAALATKLKQTLTCKVIRLYDSVESYLAEG